MPEGPANLCFGGDDYKTLFITARTSLYSVRLVNAGAKPSWGEVVKSSRRHRRPALKGRAKNQSPVNGAKA